jgi:hypothetical protein
LEKKRDEKMLELQKGNIKRIHSKILEAQLSALTDEIKAYSPKGAQLEITELCKEIEKVHAFIKVLTNAKEDVEETEKDGKGSKRKRENQVTQDGEDTKEDGEETEEDGEGAKKDGKGSKRKRENQVDQDDKMAKYRPSRVSSDPRVERATRAKRSTRVGGLRDYYANNAYSLISDFKKNINNLVSQDQQKDSKECIEEDFYCLLCKDKKHHSFLQNQVKRNPVPLGGGSFACKHCIRKIAKEFNGNFGHTVQFCVDTFFQPFYARCPW